MEELFEDVSNTSDASVVNGTSGNFINPFHGLGAVFDAIWWTSLTIGSLAILTNVVNVSVFSRNVFLINLHNLKFIIKTHIVFFFNSAKTVREIII